MREIVVSVLPRPWSSASKPPTGAAPCSRDCRKKKAGRGAALSAGRGGASLARARRGFRPRSAELSTVREEGREREWNAPRGGPSASAETCCGRGWAKVASAGASLHPGQRAALVAEQRHGQRAVRHVCFIRIIFGGGACAWGVPARQ